MIYRNFSILTFILLTLLLGCKGKNTSFNEVLSEYSDDTNTPPGKTGGNSYGIKFNHEYPDTILGDTIWFLPSTSNNWNDSIEAKGYKALINVYIDTNDFIIDTIKTSLGSKIAVGYNHFYTLNFSRQDQPWFQAEFNKKQHLESLIGGTDFWLNSNLDVIQRLVYNKTYDKFIVEFNVNPGYHYGPVYYIVFDTTGAINYTGTAGSWGGSGPDGVPFLTSDNNSFITCFEIFNFEQDTSLGIAEFASLAEMKTYGTSSSFYHWLYAMRPLSKNNFLLVFSREDENPEFNAVILNTDTTIVGHFKYYGMMDEMDAMLLFQYNERLKEYFLFDIEREMLISINENKSYETKEIALNSMQQVNGDTMINSKFESIKFEVFGKYTFFSSPHDTTIFYDFERLK
jgi:hypothetical protein